jgi:hypothetical protein
VYDLQEEQNFSFKNQLPMKAVIYKVLWSVAASFFMFIKPLPPNDIYIYIYIYIYTGCPRYKYTKINAYSFVPKRFMKFIFSALYRVTQKIFNACQYTSMWAPVVA